MSTTNRYSTPGNPCQSLISLVCDERQRPLALAFWTVPRLPEALLDWFASHVINSDCRGLVLFISLNILTFIR